MIINFRLEKMILPSLYIAETKLMGRGVFTSADIDEGTVVEESPVIVMSKGERKLLDQTLLHDYIFEWGEKKDECCMALGYIAVYNHSYRSNCEYEMDFNREMISIRTVHFIKAGQELFINYNGNWNDGKRVWFDAR
ncbi:MAG TPA: SET domain-containing protein-lysine N-methyltransferase [Chitinophagaceae bacterium]|jgi:SET domain-containing protein|nr:SET domain-containing protein-lysine N-methyltransferase [Chitinophagaceae bacterium]